LICRYCVDEQAALKREAEVIYVPVAIEWDMILSCPSCGGALEVEQRAQIAPGNFLEKCPECEAVFKIVIEFFEVENCEGDE
jgi:uncharacterized C2H2 Zn-finger protein